MKNIGLKSHVTQLPGHFGASAYFRTGWRASENSFPLINQVSSRVNFGASPAKYNSRQACSNCFFFETKRFSERTERFYISDLKTRRTSLIGGWGLFCLFGDAENKKHCEVVRSRYIKIKYNSGVGNFERHAFAISSNCPLLKIKITFI